MKDNEILVKGYKWLSDSWVYKLEFEHTETISNVKLVYEKNCEVDLFMSYADDRFSYPKKNDIDRVIIQHRNEFYEFHRGSRNIFIVEDER